MAIFDSLKKKAHLNNDVRHFKALVVGHDLSTALLVSKLLKKYSPDEICILSHHYITEKDLYYSGPAPVRGAADLELLKKYYPAAEFTRRT